MLAAAVLPALLSASVAGAQQLSAAEQSDPTLPPEPCMSLPGQGPEMVLIEGGTFLMGSPAGDAEADDDERPAHQVTVRPFALARCETSVGEFRRFVEETGYQTTAERAGNCYTVNAAGDGFEERAGARWDAPGFPQTDDHPVVCVSFDDALAYARWLSARTGAAYRLPTEAEWEYAARAGEPGPRAWPGGADAGCAHANGADRAAKARFDDWGIMDCDDGHVFPAPAGRYRRSGFGLSDMIGNVWEWVEDCWHDSYDGAPGDGTAWLDSGGECARVVRGGAWDVVARLLRAPGRGGFAPGYRGGNLGFRLARSL
jgi:formylglycine-generating enzyme required for sulfatase activity